MTTIITRVTRKVSTATISGPEARRILLSATLGALPDFEDPDDVGRVTVIDASGTVITDILDTHSVMLETVDDETVTEQFEVDDAGAVTKIDPAEPAVV